MKKILTSLILVASGLAFAQLGISKDDTNPQATLDIKALDKSNVADGILIPRVEKQKAKDMVANKTANHLQESTLIYITDGSSTVSGTAVEDVDAKGFYYFNGTKWVKIGWSPAKFKKFVLTANDQTAPKGTTLIIGSGNINPVRLPKMGPEDAGTEIIVHKNDSNNITVEDYQGLVAGETGAVIKGVSTVYANRGRTFIWTGEYWMTTNY